MRHKQENIDKYTVPDKDARYKYQENPVVKIEQKFDNKPEYKRQGTLEDKDLNVYNLRTENQGYGKQPKFEEKHNLN